MLGLTFAAPLALAALIGLPALWFLLRVTPPRPRRIDFPPLKLVADLMPQRQTPARTPPWLLILRLLIAAALFAVARIVEQDKWRAAFHRPATLYRFAPRCRDA